MDLQRQDYLSRNGWAIAQREKDGREYPAPYGEILDAIAELPDTGIDSFMMTAFSDLSTCRAIGMGVGPVPWRDVVDYAERSGLDESAAEVFVRVIRAMDDAFLEWQADKIEAAKDGSDGN